MEQNQELLDQELAEIIARRNQVSAPIDPGSENICIGCE